MTAKWITVTSMEVSSIGSDDTPVETFLNTDSIARVVPPKRGDDNKTKIVFMDGTTIRVRESMVKVRALIMDQLETSNVPPEPKDA